MGWSSGWEVTRTLIPDLSGQGGSPNPLNTKWTIVTGSTPEDVAVHPSDSGVVYEPATANDSPLCSYNTNVAYSLTQRRYVRYTALLKARDGTALQTTQAANFFIGFGTGEVIMYCTGFNPDPTWANKIRCFAGSSESTFSPTSNITAATWYRIGIERLDNIVNFLWNPSGNTNPADDPGTSALIHFKAIGPVGYTGGTGSNDTYAGFGLSGSANSASDYSGITGIVIQELRPPEGPDGDGTSDEGPPPIPGGEPIPYTPGTPIDFGAPTQLAAYRRYKNIRGLTNRMNNLTLGS